ncbi:hypothetical protein DXV75_01680 [Alteromonas aestuariivivens]|uniref:O-antigen ligase-related domain-containing protein n=1 Tax=Alteromonas aestuariivivens TaxID=1938339 RepID=A0A3D8MEE5_9ALTE|nr:O-antigen ligase family protein [Alteromonas aestuariivivens]RDV29197.1 hypothetical protein DXV75_01680 [Alteromonas aestuariivivens]
MVKLITILAMLAAMLSLLSLPWLAPGLYALYSILQPQFVWFWSFEGLPAFKFFAGLVLLSWLIQAFKSNIDFSIYKLPVNKALMLLALMVNLSHWFAPYPGGIPADLFQELFNTIILLYFACLPLLTNERALKFLGFSFLLSGAYYGFDANLAYFTGDWSHFQSGRLTGPSKGAYNDNNKFAVLFVVCVPYVLLGFFHFKNIVIKATMVLALGLIMHSILMTGSRGALLALGVAVLLCARTVKSKFFTYSIIAGFLVVVIYQGGNVLSRSQEMVTNSSASTQEPINPRIVSWLVGKDLILNHPILGVGLHRFKIASDIEYPGRSPHVAHNTLITFAAGSGILSGILYLYIFVCAFRMHRHTQNSSKDETIRYYSNAAFIGMAGYFVGALFLDMLVFEPFYYLLMCLCICYFNTIRHSAGTSQEPLAAT